MILLLAVPAACAALMQAARCPGWAVVGGVVAGICLGPTVLGRVAPDRFESVFIGGVEQREELQRLRSRQQADVAAAIEFEVDQGAAKQLREKHAREWSEAEADVAEARWEDQRPLRAFATIIIALTLIGAGPFRVRSSDHPLSWPAAISVGLWAAAVPGAVAAAALIWLTDTEPLPAVVAASAVAIGPWILTAIDRAAADEAEHGGARLIQAAGCIASLCAIAVAAIGIGLQQGAEIAGWSLVLLALPAGWVLPRLHVPGPVERVTTAAVIPVMAAKICRAVLEHLLVPALAALAMIKVELIEQFAFGPLIIFVLLSGDGRWLGAFLGAMLPGGRRAMRTMRLVLGSMACGPTQLAVTALAAHLLALPGEVVLGLVAGAVLIEVTAPARRTMANRLIETENLVERD